MFGISLQFEPKIVQASPVEPVQAMVIDQAVIEREKSRKEDLQRQREDEVRRQAEKKKVEWLEVKRQADLKKRQEAERKRKAAEVARDEGTLQKFVTQNRNRIESQKRKTRGLPKGIYKFLGKYHARITPIYLRK